MEMVMEIVDKKKGQPNIYSYFDVKQLIEMLGLLTDSNTNRINQHQRYLFYNKNT